MKTCNVCRSANVTGLLDFGDVALCNHFLTSPDQPERRFPHALNLCGDCGLVQLAEHVPVPDLVPPFDWLRYNEPEKHLDELADRICALPGLVASAACACGLSYKEDTLLARLTSLGMGTTWRIDPANDLGITDPCAGMETLQTRLKKESVPELLRRHERPDIIVARHAIEHTYDTIAFFEFLTSLVKPRGYVVLEVPDCGLLMESADYTMMWEEHTIYFTPETLQRSLSFGGLSLVHYGQYPNGHEAALVVIAQTGDKDDTPRISKEQLSREVDRARRFAKQYDVQRKALRRVLEDYSKDGGKIALFGAGHLACTFLNLMGVADRIDFVIDDSPNKKGLFMPGARTPIVGSPALVERGVKLCLTCLGPETEDKVMSAHRAFSERGGVFKSIFPGSKHSVLGSSAS